MFLNDGRSNEQGTFQAEAGLQVLRLSQVGDSVSPSATGRRLDGSLRVVLLVALQLVRVVGRHLGEVLENVLVGFITCRNDQDTRHEQQQTWATTDMSNNRHEQQQTWATTDMSNNRDKTHRAALPNICYTNHSFLLFTSTKEVKRQFLNMKTDFPEPWWKDGTSAKKKTYKSLINATWFTKLYIDSVTSDKKA